METALKTKHCVCIVEYEAGWGSTVISRHYFHSHGDAVAYAESFNADEPTLKYDSAPSIYYKAVVL